MTSDKLSTTLDSERLASLAAKLAFPTQQAALRSMHPLSTASSILYRLNFDTSTGPETLYAKLAGGARACEAQIARLRQECKVTMQVRAIMCDHDGLNTVSPVGYIDELEAFVTRAMPGRPLLEIIQSELRFRRSHSVSRLAKLAHLAGEWLREFHSLTPNAYAPDFYAYQIRYCDYRLDTLTARNKSWIDEKQVARLRDCVREWTSTVSLSHGYNLPLCHNDYSPHNIMAHQGNVHILDFSFAAPSLSCFDQLCFWHKLEELKCSPLYAESAIEALQTAFFAGYGATLGLTEPAARLGLVRLILNKLITLSTERTIRPDRWIENLYRRQDHLSVLRSYLAV